MTHEGRRMDVTFQPDGTLELVETEVPEADLPAAVSKWVKDQYPGSRLTWWSRSRKAPR